MYYCDGNDNGVDEEGLLPSLRRPDLSDMAPELFSLLQLKESDLNAFLQSAQPELLTNLINAQLNNRGNQSANASNSSDHTSGNNYSGMPNVINVAATQIKTPSQNNNTNSTEVRNSAPQNTSQPPGQSRGNNNKLSPSAKEFVPKPYALQNSDTANLAMAVAQVQATMHNQFPSQNQSQSQNDTDNNTDCVLSTITDTINQLTINPPDFQRCAKLTTDVLKQYLNDADDILGIVVTLLVEQSISNANFCYSGARLCQVLHKNDIKTPVASFKVLLISRCQEEFQSCLKNLATDANSLQRTHGFLRFLGELYMNFHIEQSGKTVPITIFGLAATELMSKLISTSPTYENIKFVFQLLKLLGWEFENAADARLKSEMEKFIKDLSYLLVLKQLPTETIKLLEALFALKGKKWNKVEEVQQPRDNAVPCPWNFSQPQFFELPDEVDDDDFDGGNILLDDEPDGVGEAYEAFLKELEGGRRK